MAIVVVDGIEIDTTQRIDTEIAKFKNQGERLGKRRRLISKEIATRKGDLQVFSPSDRHGQAHLRAYIQELERVEKELSEESERKVKDAIRKPESV